MANISFDQMRGILAQLPRAVGDMMIDKPAEMSQASQDIKQGGEPANAVRALMELAITSAADHISSLERGLTEPVMTFSPWTTARGVLETASTAMWLLQAEDFQRRMARGLTLRLEHLYDESRYARDAQKRHPHITQFTEALPVIEDRVRHLAQVAARFGVSEKRSKRGLLTGFGENMPSNTELAERGFGEGSTYRLLSAAAHNRTWAARMVSLRALDSGIGVEQHLRVEAALFIIVNVTDWFVRSVWAYFEYNGWDLDGLKQAFEEQYDQSAIDARARFWRTGPH